ncbi:MAG: alpha/beta hydrolase, partial [Rhodospirillaceae bacterium]|nr:alpha/beta hydrolase [Rhodospirillaceae bacterium]
MSKFKIEQFRQILVDLPEFSAQICAYVPPEFDENYLGTWSVVVHGAFRNSLAMMNELAGNLSPNPMLFLDLPGFGHSSLPPLGDIQTIGSILAAGINQLLHSQPLVLIGESVAGLFLMRAAQDLPTTKAIIGLDVPLTMSKLWTNLGSQQGIWHQYKTQMDQAHGDQKSMHARQFQFINEFMIHVYGYDFSHYNHGRLKRMGAIHYPLFAELTVPMLILCGDTPLMPPRNLQANDCFPC